MAGKVSRHESELWSYVSSGDGEHCPLYDHCRQKQRTGVCVGDNLEQVKRLFEECRFNPRHCDCIRPVNGCRVFQLVEMLAQEWQLRGRVYQLPVPNELVSLADDQHPIEVRAVPLKAYRGAIWWLKEVWVIQLRKSDSLARKRLTLFHEAFHILAHYKATPVFKRAGTSRGSFNELLADCFAACVLMPREWVKEMWAEVKDLDTMARIFTVPKPVMCARLKYLGFI